MREKREWFKSRRKVRASAGCPPSSTKFAPSLIRSPAQPPAAYSFMMLRQKTALLSTAAHPSVIAGMRHRRKDGRAVPGPCNVIELANPTTRANDVQNNNLIKTTFMIHPP